jgi:general secretion pathway protein G
MPNQVRYRRALARRSGFSLVEILLVIVIILMLAGALVVYVLPQQEGAQRNTTFVKLQQIQQGLQTYKINVGSYPTEEQGGLGALLRKPAFENEKLASRWGGPYLSLGVTLDDSWGHALIYEVIDKTLVDDKSGPDIRLFSVGPDGVRDTPDDVKLYDENAAATEDAGAPGAPGAGTSGSGATTPTSSGGGASP